MSDFDSKPDSFLDSSLRDYGIAIFIAFVVYSLWGDIGITVLLYCFVFFVLASMALLMSMISGDGDPTDEDLE